MKPFNVRGLLGNLSKLTKQAHVHQMIGVMVVVAHASQIGEVVSHISIWHLLIAFTLFALWLYSPEHEHMEGI